MGNNFYFFFSSGFQVSIPLVLNQTYSEQVSVIQPTAGMRSDSCITVWRFTESEIITFNLTVLSKRPRNPLAGLSVSERQIIPVPCAWILKHWILILKEFYLIARWKEVTRTCYFSRVYALPGCWQLEFVSVPRYTYKLGLKIFVFKNHYFI